MLNPGDKVVRKKEHRCGLWGWDQKVFLVTDVQQGSIRLHTNTLLQDYWFNADRFERVSNNN